MRISIRAFLVSMLFVPAIAAAQAGSQDATGTWAVRLNAPDGPHDATLTLTKAGEALTGAIRSPEGEIKVTGTQKGADVALSFTYTADVAMLITMKGTQNGDAISGPATFADAAGDWTGKRQPAGGAAPPAPAAGTTTAAAGALDVSGAWVLQIETPAGSATPTVTFKQSGEALTGTYAGQFGEAPITGTLKGDQLTFSLDLTVQDMKLHIVYSGTVTSDSIKGTASLGDMGEAPFTGKRK